MGEHQRPVPLTVQCRVAMLPAAQRARRLCASLGRGSRERVRRGVVGPPSLARKRVVLIQVVFGLGWVALGYALWSERGEPHAADARGGRSSGRQREAG